MKSYNYTKRDGQETDAELKLSGQEITAMPPDTSFTKAALEWNNALSIAAERMWGDAAPLQRKFT